MIGVAFFVPGIPRPGGSKRAFMRPGMRFPVITDVGGEHTKNWRAVVALAARGAYEGLPLTGPLNLSVKFVMPRPKAHYRANGELKPNAPHFVTKAPDCTKLLRSLEDACTGILWVDDSLIVEQSASKVFGELPGAQVSVTTVGDLL